MEKPIIPDNEQSRLKALHSLNVLDTPPEERFDRLTRLAKRMFNVPIALVSLVDENRQWFKSCVGLSVCETPRDISFCGHTILGNDIFIVPDTLVDPRFADNPLVLNDPFIRFYAGCPLRHLDGSMLGTLCIIDQEPRDISQEDLDILNDLADLASRELMAIELATLDELTKISNRRGFIKLAKHSLTICTRQNIPVSIAFLDLNSFKPINDTFGHAEGDTALIAFAELMKKSFRKSDVFARIGGDEFAILLTDTLAQPAEKTMARFRRALRLYNKTANRGYNIEFSEGIIPIDLEQTPSIESLLNQADSLMYQQKNTSRK
ncbi:sensor domain-containing diguanylate cyclase [Cycloclasticus pugetii]|jgi:diguanylate cyclase (GGDEF)-like protein|uniref:sensor domain-containing diguanylate cyclase n=1 Tax=Cycloclasticus pugetii TaxID=34068 RepID=UPI0009170CA1|nr:sensor domain-containing diguanylate cyclase [Cycloclasticus pugetii]SHI89938.1 diguanylate cyclase with GAF sensor [Cycloclasticus pugetii]